MSHLLGPIVFRIGDDKEVRGDEEKAHTVSSDYESFTALRFNASVSTRQISVSCLLTGDNCGCKIYLSLFSLLLLFFKELE
jgi:hypothetical protein